MEVTELELKLKKADASARSGVINCYVYAANAAGAPGVRVASIGTIDVGSIDSQTDWKSYKCGTTGWF